MQLSIASGFGFYLEDVDPKLGHDWFSFLEFLDDSNNNDETLKQNFLQKRANNFRVTLPVPLHVIYNPDTDKTRVYFPRVQPFKPTFKNKDEAVNAFVKFLRYVSQYCHAQLNTYDFLADLTDSDIADAINAKTFEQINTEA